eukprot:3885342-Pyramimonas_sp.AAC.1
MPAVPKYRGGDSRLLCLPPASRSPVRNARGSCPHAPAPAAATPAPIARMSCYVSWDSRLLGDQSLPTPLTSKTPPGEPWQTHPGWGSPAAD